MKLHQKVQRLQAAGFQHMKVGRGEEWWQKKLPHFCFRLKAVAEPDKDYYAITGRIMAPEYDNMSSLDYEILWKGNAKQFFQNVERFEALYKDV